MNAFQDAEKAVGLIPGDKLLPAPAIMKVIAAHYPTAPEEIFTRAKEIQEERCEKDRARLDESRGRRRVANVLGALLGEKVPPLRPAYKDAAVAMNHEWARVGNDLRHAMNEFITGHPGLLPIILESVSDEEWDSIGYLPVGSFSSQLMGRNLT